MRDDFCCFRMAFTKGMISSLADVRETWHLAAILAHMVSKVVLLLFVQNKVEIFMGNNTNSKGSKTWDATVVA